MRLLLVPALAMVMASPAIAQSVPDWQDYTDSTYGFTAELPLGVFEAVDAGSTPGITLQEVGGEASLSVYGGPAEGMTRDALEARLEGGEEISTITYRAGGESWFVLSGYYKADGAAEQTIFYTKVLFSPEHDTFSAFEISFPAEDKPRFEQLVERFEDNFTRPTR